MIESETKLGFSGFFGAAFLIDPDSDSVIASRCMYALYRLRRQSDAPAFAWAWDAAPIHSREIFRMSC